MTRLLQTLLLGCALAFASIANADVIPITNDGDPVNTDDNFNDITGGNPLDVTILGWLQGEILSYENHHTGVDLPDPTPNVKKWEDLQGVGPTIDVVAGDYIVLHYGVGPNGVPGSGGGLVALLAVADQSYTVPDDGSGPNGFGGISFVEVWDHVPSTPDGGTTALLLGAALTGLGLVRRRLAR